MSFDQQGQLSAGILLSTISIQKHKAINAPNTHLFHENSHTTQADPQTDGANNIAVVRTVFFK